MDFSEPEESLARLNCDDTRLKCLVVSWIGLAVSLILAVAIAILTH